MLSLRLAPPPKPVRPTLALLAAGLLLASTAAVAQTAPKVSTIVAFSGSVPGGRIVQGSDGALYGTTIITNTVVSGGLIYRATADGSSITTLYQLDPTVGLQPKGGLLLGIDGLFYGVTRLGSNTTLDTSGTTFRLAQDGSGFTILHRFATWSTTNVNSNPINADGAYPDAPMIEGGDGYLYGTTRAGGANGTGVVYRQSRDGTSFTVLHEFGPVTSAATDRLIKNVGGAAPAGSLVLGADGYLYGAAAVGGLTGNGTIFRLHLDGTGFEVVHEFTDLSSATPGTNADGATPLTGLVDGNDGLLYGVASAGGAQGYGVLFSLDPASGLLVVLHDFDSTHGANPSSELTVGTDTRLYGTTSVGGSTSTGTATSHGTIFSIARDGTDFSMLYSFDATEGSGPAGPLLQLNPTTFVGVAAAGGKCSSGTLFNYSSTGAIVAGNTGCGQKKNQYGGGGTEPLVVLLFGVLGLAARRRRD